MPGFPNNLMDVHEFYIFMLSVRSVFVSRAESHDDDSLKLNICTTINFNQSVCNNNMLLPIARI